MFYLNYLKIIRNRSYTLFTLSVCMTTQNQATESTCGWRWGLFLHAYA